MDAGWDGHLTLELSNVANLPITVYPGMKIGQISFLQMTTAAEHPYGSKGLGSKYQGQRGPTPSRYFENFRRLISTLRLTRTTQEEACARQDRPRPRPLTAVAFAIAGRRFYFLYRLVAAGRPTSGRFKERARAVWAELSEVAGQRKLLQWTVPGLAHFFTMWGFTILLLTIIEAYGDLFNKSSTSRASGTGTGSASSRTSSPWPCWSPSRLRRHPHENAPKRLERKSRFYGSHPTPPGSRSS